MNEPDTAAELRLKD